LNQYAKLSLEFCAMLLVSADGINRLPQESAAAAPRNDVYAGGYFGTRLFYFSHTEK
jgi:hypothetical protein